ncbi:MAG TPA: molybdenum cofactor biosynthesis protein, partial [Chromatiales bacterium]|nr:molybdenum cofactor biosynthesis protein [Chromatiales bacterium]
MSKEREFIPLNIAVMTVSDTRTEETDKSGALLVKMIQEAGHRVFDKLIVRDDIYRIRAEVSRWVADESVQVVITTGGTGITGRDGTPEAVRPLLDKVIDGFGEMFRVLSYESIGTSTL